MMMDYRPQQPGEHDFVYAARILRAAATNFDAMMANGSYHLAELRTIGERLDTLVHNVIDTQLDPHARRTTACGSES
jgi:hypothetical protein